MILKCNVIARWWKLFRMRFSGCCCPREFYEHCDRLQTEHKSDWMYRKVAEQGTYSRLSSAGIGWTEQGQQKQFLDQAGPDGDHDLRAAFICLLTAGFAAHGTAVVVGGPMHGWFWLPPTKFWQAWASTALGRQIQKLKEPKFPDGRCWTAEFFMAVNATVSRTTPEVWK